MTRELLGALLLLTLVPACGSDDSSSGSGGGSGTAGAGAGGSSSGGSGGGSTGGTGATSTGGTGATSTGGTGATSTGGTGATSTGGSAGAATGGTGGNAWSAGNPDGSCSTGVPAEGQLADTSSPTTVVGTGTAASCTFEKLAAAVTKGGIITFDCGGPATIPITATLVVPIGTNTVIDGKKQITLDGQSKVRILSFSSANWQANEHRLTLQRIALVNGKTTPTQAIPPAPAPCSQGWNDGQGGALYMRDGNLSVIDSIFTGNKGAPLGPDTGGGAIYVQGSKHGVVIAGSTFTQNSASNAGAVGGLFTELRIYNSLFSKNTATGNGANNDDASKCSVINNGQHQTGSGGNGGAIYSDGNSVDVVLCGNKIVDNAAGTGAFGGGLFFTSNNMVGDLSIIDTTMTGNTGGFWTKVATGTVTKAGTAVGTNCHSITIKNSTLQGLP